MVEHPSPEDVMAWVDGQAGDAGPVVEEHLRACASCRAVAGEFRDMSAQLSAWTVEPRVFDMPVPRSGRVFPWRWVSMAALVAFSLFLWSWFGSAPTPDRLAPQAPAPVLIEVFIDWQCPSCAHLEYGPVVEAYEKSRPGVVKYVLKDYPLNRRCNSHVPGESHAAACEAAVAMRIARDRGKAEELTGWLFGNQSSLTPAVVKAKAQALLAVPDFDAEYAKRLPDVLRDVEEGAARQLRFTPSVFVNGKIVNDEQGNWPTPERLDRMIRELITGRRLY